MTKDEACLSLHNYLMDYLEEREYFLSSATVSPKDEAALVIASVTPSPKTQRTNVLFYCASSLDPARPPVTHWVDECVAAARRNCTEEVAALDEWAVSCLREAHPGLAQ